ncbi:MAG TPA: thiamine pyrophosphate-dependent enzyme [Caldisericia bacterium]|nr:thiamine pyrophosphate-dependent enzyme [Caldisericia bacterium]HOL82716.1 thiamine pyrophosphate-dependent enzyme [Caldisericia bacterium]HON82571.1 thiamine pyrophosphate-dependent enzyme [Caldisericia bacterium]HPC56901.1 thiamine pyrophosphate-dependent enzyme [Caldisericia bacterium]HPP43449.1 thiamine pyrophosphate-dependent enzyme [Caldisericia bacterium]
MEVKPIYTYPKSMEDKVTNYCPGCHHGIVHKLVAELIDEMNLFEKTIIVWPVGCSVVGYEYFKTDGCIAAHGRAPAMATGIKRANPEKFVLSYQGDGDLASIGMAEIVHAAARGEKITVVFINNTNYGMTGGQMAPTTLPGQKTTTSPYGRDPNLCGWPIRVSELLSTIDGAAYIARAALNKPARITQAKKYLKKAFNTQLKGIGFSLVEFISACPVQWHMTPLKSLERIENELIPYYPLGEFKVKEGVTDVS